ncbi:glycosyltransferase [Flavobacteriales bacterium]|nr:glycosyltransferase [Flavobacteriales bacterium]
MPVKNAGPFLQECVDSILSQTESNWELIAVNDGSTDDSKTILQSYAAKDARVRFLDNTGNGIIEALRMAYSNSSGEFITRMDADDWMFPNKLKVLKENIESNSRGYLAVGKVKYFSDDELKGGYIYYENWLNSLTEKGTNYSEVYRECVIPSPCWMVYRTDLDKCKAFEPNTYPEDYDLCFRFKQAGLNPIPCSEVLHNWRDHSTRTSRNDPNYADNRFLDLKLHWFLKLDYDPSKTLVIWGAASKGKELAKGLIKDRVPFEWMCNNPNKIDKHVYGKHIKNVVSIRDLGSFQAIVAVANKTEQAEIHSLLKPEEAFFFC